MSCFRLLGVFALLISFALASAWAQAPFPVGRHADTVSDPDQAMQRTAQQMRQKQRARDMKRDSEKLLELATQLKQYVDKAGDNMLSLEVLKKADEMEKLARQVKKNMQGE